MTTAVAKPDQLFQLRRDDQKHRERQRRWAQEDAAEAAQERHRAQRKAQGRQEKEETRLQGEPTGRAAEALGDPTGRAPVHPTPNPHVELQGPLTPSTGLPPGSSSKAPPPRRLAGGPHVPDTGLALILGAMDFPSGAIEALQQDPWAWEHLGRIASAGEAGWERDIRRQVAVSMRHMEFPTEPALGTESTDSPAALDEGSPALPSEEGLPTGFAHGACPTGLAHRAHPQGSPSAKTVARRDWGRSQP